MSRKVGWQGAPTLAVAATVLVLFVAAAVATVAAQEEVSNAEELQNVSEDLDADYVLVEDIDLSGAEEFEPIGGCDFVPEEGRCADRPFNGSFDGEGHAITNLTIDGEDKSDVGLFGGVGEGGMVENLRLEGVRVTGNAASAGLVGTNGGGVTDVHLEGRAEGGSGVGLLVGLNRGIINDSSATGTVEATGRSVGGLVGSNDGVPTDSRKGVVLRSQADVDVVSGISEAGAESTDTAWVGGLVGSNFGGDIRRSSAEGGVRSDGTDIGGLVGTNIGGEVTESSAEGSVTVSQKPSDGAAVGLRVGGLVGSNVGTVTESRAEGNVTGNASVGGLVGRSRGGEIDGSVATGAVSGNEEVGGLVGAIGDRRLKEGMTVVLRNSRWEVDKPDLPTVGVVEEGNGEVVVENVTPAFEQTAENGTEDADGTDDDEGGVTEGGNGSPEEGSGSDSSGKGLPGFTFLTALVALVTAAVVFARSSEK